MNWILIIIIIFQGEQFTIEINPISKFFCDKIVDVMSSKTITINNEGATLKAAACIKSGDKK